ncbi:MAG TPA: hypothetical protein VHM25_02585 [Polyangiaceae bacterium]|jgi:hypothetical protein|nr:hypothetical protein [Polyangiaceae bacterium]
MSLRSRRASLASILLASALLAACVGAPDDAAQLSGDHALVQRSEHGLVEATVALHGSELARGVNDFSITLRAADSFAQPTLKSVDATMAVHGHRADATRIVSDGEAFHTNLDLFMSGRWQIALGVELDASSDVVEFALDVP